jgi:hypothetical protein
VENKEGPENGEKSRREKDAMLWPRKARRLGENIRYQGKISREKV